MPFGEAAATYALLSIGDGLVAQLPALLVSSAVAMLVTRASRSQDMAQAMTGQVFGQYRALAITAGIIGLVGLVPGMRPTSLSDAGLDPRLHCLEAVPQDPGPGRRCRRNGQGPGGAQRPRPPGRAGAHRRTELGRTAPGRSAGPGGRLPADSAGGQQPGRRTDGAHQGVRRKLTQDVGFLIPSVHPRQPGTARQRLPRAGARRAGGHRRDPPRPRARAGPGQRAWHAGRHRRQGPRVRPRCHLDPTAPACPGRNAGLHGGRPGHRGRHPPFAPDPRART